MPITLTYVKIVYLLVILKKYFKNLNILVDNLNC